MSSRGLIARGRIGHGGGHHDWLSRDYEHIDCRAVGCLFNRGGVCGVPSKAKFNEEAKCEGFTLPPTKPGKLDGD